jgi:hypothetical protein
MANWQPYADTQFGFKLSYPPDFAVEDSWHGSPPPDWPLERRAVDKRHLVGQPPGQVEFGIYKKDADTLAAWIQKHTGPCFTGRDPIPYWDTVTNMKSTTVSGHEALSFDWDTSHCASASIVHETVFFLGSAFVFRFDWWATDRNHSTTLQPIAQQMLASLSA